MKADFLPA